MSPDRSSQVSDAAARMRNAAARYGVVPARMDEIAPGRAIAVKLIGSLIASEAAFAAVHARTGVGVFVYRDETGAARGFMGMILLRASGLAKIDSDRFDALDPSIEDVCLPGEEPAAVYGWGLAATTARASAAVVKAMMAAHDEALPDVPFFSRAATAAGAKVLHGKLGYERYPKSTTSILVKRPAGRSLEHAA